MLTDFHNYFTVRLSDNFATKVDQSYRYGFGGLVFFWNTVYIISIISYHIITHFHSLVFTLNGRIVHGVGEVSSRRNVQQTARLWLHVGSSTHINLNLTLILKLTLTLTLLTLRPYFVKTTVKLYLAYSLKSTKILLYLRETLL